MKNFLLKLFIASIPLLLLCGWYGYEHWILATNHDLSQFMQRGFNRKYLQSFKDNCSTHNTTSGQHKAFFCHFNQIGTSTCDILVIGDSFSLSKVVRASGIRSFQQVLSEQTGLSVATLVHSNTASPFDIAYTILCDNTLCPPPVMVVESVERHLIARLQSLSLINLSNYDKDILMDKDLVDNNLCIFVQHRIAHKEGNKVKLFQTKAPINSCPHEETHLYTYFQDINFRERTNKDVAQAATIIDSLYLIAQQRNVELICLIAPDKFDLYQDLIADNPYPRNTLLDKGSTLDRIPFVVNGKQVLLPLIRQGQKDLYYVDDTHWTPLAAKAIGQTLAHHIIALKAM